MYYNGRNYGHVDRYHEIAENAGLVSQLAGRMRPVLKFLFPGLEPDSPACHYISLNFYQIFLGFPGQAPAQD